MALRNDPRLYSGGTLTLNSAPYTQMMQQLLARKQARDEAIDSYYADQDKELNKEGSGVRAQDLPGFENRINSLKQYYSQNRDALRKKDIQAQSEYQRIYRDTMNYARQSKDREVAAKEAVDLMGQYRKEDMNPEVLFGAIDANKRALDDKGSTRFDSTSFLLQNTPYDDLKHFNKYKDTPRDIIDIQYGETDPKTGKRTVTTSKKFDPQIKEQLFTRFTQDYDNSFSFNKRVKDIISNPEERAKLATVAREEFGIQPNGDGEYPNEVYAAAYGMRQLNPALVDKKEETDAMYLRDLDAKNREKMVRLNDSLARGRIQLQEGLKANRAAAKSAKTAQEQESILNRHIKEQYDNGEPLTVINVNGQNFKGKYAPVSPEIVDKLTISKGNDDEKIPSKVMITEDGKYVIPIYTPKGEKNKTKEGRNRYDASLSKPILMSDYKSILGKSWGLTGKIKYGEMGDEFESDSDDPEGLF